MAARFTADGSPLDKALRSPFPDEVQQTKIRARQRSRQDLEAEKSPFQARRLPASAGRAPSLPNTQWLIAFALVVFGGLLAIVVQHYLLPASPDTLVLSGTESHENGFQKDLSFCGKGCTAEDILDVAKHHMRRLEKEKAALSQYLARVNATVAKLQPTEQALQSCRLQSQKQELELRQLSVLDDRLARSKQEAEVLSNDRQKLQQQLAEVKASAADATRMRAKIQEEEADAKDLHAQLSKVTQEQQEASRMAGEGEAREQALRAELQEKQRRLNALGDGAEACSAMLDQSQAAVRRFRLQVIAASMCLICLAAVSAWAYRKWTGRKIWRLQSELAKVQSRLAVAQTGVPQRVRAGV